MIELKSSQNVKYTLNGREVSVEVEITVASKNMEAGRLVEFALSRSVEQMNGKVI